MIIPSMFGPRPIGWVATIAFVTLGVVVISIAALPFAIALYLLDMCIRKLFDLFDKEG